MLPLAVETCDQHRCWGNPPQTLGKSVTDFDVIRHWFWRIPSEIRHRLWETSRRLWGNVSSTLGKIGSVLRKDWLGFKERLARFGRKFARFLDWLWHLIQVPNTNPKTVSILKFIGLSNLPFQLARFLETPKTSKIQTQTCLVFKTARLELSPTHKHKLDIPSSYWG